MKPSFLGLSLVGNALLLAGVAYLALTPPTQQSNGKPAEEAKRDLAKPSSAGHGAPIGVAPSPALIPTTIPWQSPDDVEAWLRSTGAPLKVRFAVVQALLSQKYGAAYSAVRHPPGMKRWQLSIPPSPEQREQMSAISREQKQELQRIFGDDYAKASFADNIEDLTGIPAEKLVEINRVTRDYMEIRQKAGGPITPAERRLLDEEMRVDLANILTPKEFELYQAYDSQEGQRLQRSMAGLDVDDETYLRIYRAAAEVQARNKQTSSTPSVRTEEIRAIEKAVGPEIAAHISMNQQDTAYREISALYAAAKIPPIAMLEKYELWNQFHQNLPNAAPGKLNEAQKALVLSYHDGLTDGLSPAAQATFDRTRTGVLMARLLGTK